LALKRNICSLQQDWWLTTETFHKFTLGDAMNVAFKFDEDLDRSFRSIPSSSGFSISAMLRW